MHIGAILIEQSEIADANTLPGASHPESGWALKMSLHGQAAGKSGRTVHGDEFRLAERIHVGHETDHRRAGVGVEIELFDLERVHREDVAVRRSRRRSRAAITCSSEIGARLQRA